MSAPVRALRSFLLDMDGTLYLGDELLPGAREFLDTLARTGRRFIYLTNNSSRSREDYVRKLTRLGLPAEPEDIFTSAEATAIWLGRQKPGASLCVLGVPGLQKDLEAAGFPMDDKHPDFCVLGFDTTLCYDRLWRFCDLVREGVPFIATHPDFNCPLPGGKMMPDAGAMAALITASTGVSPTVIGKPERPMADAIFAKYGFDPATCAMVGDRLYTDVAFGRSAGISSVLVLSGETSLDDYNKQTKFHADYIFPSVGELSKELEDHING